MSRQFRISIIAMTILVTLLSCNKPISPSDNPDFTLEPALKTLELAPGGETSIWVKLNRDQDFDDTVKMFLDNLPVGVSQRWSRDTDNGDCTLILSADDLVEAGTYKIDLLGETQAVASSSLASQIMGSQELTTQQTVQLNLTIGALFLNASVQPSILNVPANSKTGMLISINNVPTSATPSLNLQGAPTGVTASFGPLSDKGNDKTALMTLIVSPTTVLGSYDFKVEVKVNTTTKLLPVSLTVTAEPANPTFKIFNSALSLNLSQRGSQPFPVFISRIKGFDQSISLTLDTSQTQLKRVSAAPVISSGLLGSLNIVTVSASPLNQPFQAKITGLAGTLSKSANLTITIKLPSGSLDTTFAGDGVLEIGDAANNIPNVLGFIALQSTDKIVFVNKVNEVFTLKRFNTDGSQDTGFGTNGLVTFNPNIVSLNILKLDVDKSNRIVIATNQVGAAANSSLVVFRHTANGAADTTFGGNGRLVIPKTISNEDIKALKPLSSGKILIATTFNNGTGAFLYLIKADGTGLDTGFGTAGRLSLSILKEINDIEEQSDGKLVLAARNVNPSHVSLIVRLLANGALDSSFSGNGFVDLAFPQFNRFGEIELDRANRVVVAGDALPTFLTMARVTPAGEFDTSFSGDGQLLANNTELGFDVFSPRGLEVQADNKLVMVILNNNTNETNFLIRLTENGVLDTSFSNDGKVELQPILGSSISQSLLDSKGRIIVKGLLGIARFAP